MMNIYSEGTSLLTLNSIPCPIPCINSKFLEIGGTVFPRIISMRGRLFDGLRLIEGGDYFKYCSLEVLMC